MIRETVTPSSIHGIENGLSALVGSFDHHEGCEGGDEQEMTMVLRMKYSIP